MANAAEAEFDQAQVEGEEESGAGKPAKKSALSFKTILLALGVIVLLGGGYVAYDRFLAGESAPVRGEPVFVSLPEVTVNLNTGDSARVQYLRLSISLEIGDKQTAEQITPMMPRVLDAFQVHLREMRPEDLNGSAALVRLKEELLKRINSSTYPHRVEAILFNSFLIQ